MKQVTFIAAVLVTFSLLGPNAARPQSQQEIEQATQVMKDAGMDQAQIDQIIASMKMATALEQATPSRRSSKPKPATTAAAKPSIPAPSLEAQPGQLLLAVNGNEQYSFELTRCTTNSHRNANLMVLAEAMAIGDFRGEPAVVFLSKSHPWADHGGSARMFEELEIWLRKISPSERNQTKFELAQAEQQAFDSWHNPRAVAIKDQFQVDDSMSMAQINAAMDAQNAAYDALAEEALQRRTSKAHSYGAVAIDGLQIQFLSNAGIGPLDKTKAKPFLNSRDIAIEAVADCAK